MHRYSRLFALLLLCLAFGSAWASQEKARRWKVIVIVPEKHLTQPRIPDPAAETALCKALADAGYKVMDQDRVRELRSNAVEDRILRGGKGAEEECKRLARKFGADVLVTGEAFSQLVQRRQVETDLGQVTQFVCRARVELKAIRMDTGERFFSDAIQKSGEPELTEELGSKACLGEAGEELSSKLIEKMGALSAGSTAFVEVEVRNVSFTEGAAIREALRKSSGVVDVDQGEFEAKTWSMEITVRKSALPSIAAAFEANPLMRKRKLSVQSASKSKIVLVKG
jgi:hypothetical protein